VPGVCWLPSHQKWGAKIGKKHLGYFVELTAAVAARKQAESTLWNLPKGG
jgi:GH25 family lysozyme M1 (1,4-beta-N-acetylmuramidase)